MKIILGSASPRRQELLHMIFSDFAIQTTDEDENCPFHTPSQFVQDLATQKGKLVQKKMQSISYFNTKETYLIISADTIVYANGAVLGKPHTYEQAFDMLSSLSNSSHKVFTGVCISEIQNNTCIRQSVFDESTTVKVMHMSENEIDCYIKTNDCFDKAGGYGIQGLFGKHIEGIEGDYYNVVGLPVNRLYRELKNMGLI